MRGTGRLQKFLYLIMLALGAYILYKTGCILRESTAAQQALDAGEVQRGLEDAAMRTWAPGYTAAVEDRGMPDWMAKWMGQVAPVYSYLAEGQASEAEPETEMPAGKTASAEEPEAGQETEMPAGKTGSAGEAEAEPETETTGAQRQASGAEPETADAEGQASGAEAGEKSSEAQPAAATGSVLGGRGRVVPQELLARLEDFDYLLSNYYTVDEGTMADAQLLDADVLLGTDLEMEQDPSVPQILIYHTHSQEAFADSAEGATEDTIVGMGEVLAGELRDAYGYNVIHDTGTYDLVDGVLDRSAAYDYARESVEQILQEHPTIEVVIDLHRDGVEGMKFVTEIGGAPASMIMFFNGISRDSADQPIPWLENPYLQDNLAFSLQLQLAAREQYPGFTRNIYLKAERFNLHLRPRSLLIEAGTQMNTVEEERNAMKPLAALLHQVLSGG